MINQEEFNKLWDAVRAANSYQFKYIPPMDVDIQWIKPVLNSLYGKPKIKPPVYKRAEEIANHWHEWVYEAPPLEFKPLTREELDKLVRNSYVHDAVLPLSAVRTIIFKKEKETAMNKIIKDYIGVLVDNVTFDPPYTTVMWSDTSITRVKCVDEPYDPEKGFVMAVQKKLFGDVYYKDMKDIIEKYDGYKKATHLVKLVGDYRAYMDSDVEEIEKLKKELDWITGMKNDLMAERDRLLEENYKLRCENYCKYDVTILTQAIHAQVVEERDKLKKENESLKRALKNKQNVVDNLETGYIRVSREKEDLKKAKENMAKKLAETKQLKKDLDAQMLKNGELDRENQRLRRDIEIKSDTIGRQSASIHNLREWFRREAEKVSILQKHNNTQAETIHTLMKEAETLKLSIKQINQIKEILK